MKSEKVSYLEAESRTVAIRGGEVEKKGRQWSKGAKLQLGRMKCRDLSYNVIAIVNNTILKTEIC